MELYLSTFGATCRDRSFPSPLPAQHSSMSAKKKKGGVRTIRSYLQHGAKSFLAGQGFHSIGFDGEQRIVTKDWADKCESIQQRISALLTEPIVTGGEVQFRRILTERAKSVIRTAIENGRFRNRSDATESTYMAPSDDPDAYSRVRLIDYLDYRLYAHATKWCSFCKDFGEILVLCAGCRVGVCVTPPGLSTGCLFWGPSIDDDDFVFYCPICATAAKKPCVVRTEWILQYAHN